MDRDAIETIAETLGDYDAITVTAEEARGLIALALRALNADAVAKPCIVSEAIAEADIIQRWKVANGYNDLLQAYSDAIDARDKWARQYAMISEAQASALSGEADAVRRAESAELGCEIAYRREPTSAEGDAHADGGDECFVPMGGWTGRRCRVCRVWTWGGPTCCVQCVARDAAESDMRERAAGVLDARAKEIRMGEASFVALARFTECSESAAAIRALPLNGGGK